MRQWLAETRGQDFELLRHFLRRFFESDLVTSKGHTATALIGAFTLILPWFQVLIDPLKKKYAHFGHLPTPGPYRQVVRADELWLLTLMMAAVGLLTAVKWQALFPGLRDYYALGSLPLRARQIFQAKLLALVTIVTALIVVLNAFPGMMFPALSAGRWQYMPVGGRIQVHTASSVLGCYFTFFALVALQGVLLNLLPPRPFERITGSIQGVLVAVMLVLIVLSFSIQAPITNTVLAPGFSRWLPPVWFLGLYQTMAGDPDPVMHALARRALVGLALAAGLALASYVISYARHRKLLVEGVRGRARDHRWSSKLLDWLVRDPRQQAVMVFMAKTLARNSHHRVILMGYCGFGAAIVISGILSIRSLLDPQKTIATYFIYAHVIVMVFLVIGFRHLFSIPVELKANWTFQMTERQGRAEWMNAVDRFVLVVGFLLMLAIPFPLEVRLLGWRAVAESAIFVAFGLLCYEAVFVSWDKLPFTCSVLPGKTPPWIRTLQLLALLGSFPAVNGILVFSLYNRIGFFCVLALLLAAWTRVRAMRRQSWGELNLKYEEAPDPAVQSLHLVR
jgi:hypothetical protein